MKKPRRCKPGVLPLSSDEEDDEVESPPLAVRKTTSGPAISAMEHAEDGVPPSPRDEHKKNTVGVQEEKWPSPMLLEKREQEDGDDLKSEKCLPPRSSSPPQKRARETSPPEGARPQKISTSAVIDLTGDDDEEAGLDEQCALDAAYARSLQEQGSGGWAADASSDDAAFARSLQEQGSNACSSDEAFARQLHEQGSDASSSDAAYARSLQEQGSDEWAANASSSDAAFARSLQEQDTCSSDDAAVARRLQAQEYKKNPQRPPPSQTRPEHHRLVGDHFMLNRLSADIASRGGDGEKSRAKVVDPETLLWWTPGIERAIFASFGVNYTYLNDLLRGTELITEPGRVVVVDNYDHSSPSSAGVTRGTSDRPFTVVFPPFAKPGASAAEHKRYEKGSVHPKLWILIFKDFMRVVISSANLGAYDNKMNNNYWAHDFLLRGSSSVVPVVPLVLGESLEPVLGAETWGQIVEWAASDEQQLELALDPVKRQAVHRWAGPGLSSRSKGEGHERRLILQKEPTPNFGGELRRFVGSLLIGDAGLAKEWDGILAQFEQEAPPGVHLIQSVPGSRTGKEAAGFGHLALKRALAGIKRAEFACSSLGTLEQSFLREFKESLFGSSQGDLRVVWPSFENAVLDYTKSLAIGALTEDHGGAAMCGPSEEMWNKEKYPRDLFCHNVGPSDRRTLHHYKMIALYDAAEGLKAVLGGSHNLSGAAWGVQNGKEQVIMSYELGVLVKCDESMLPWKSPAAPYDDYSEPFSGKTLARRLGGEGRETAIASDDALRAAQVFFGERSPITVLACPLPKRLLSVASSSSSNTSFYDQSLDSRARLTKGKEAGAFRRKREVPATLLRSPAREMGLLDDHRDPGEVVVHEGTLQKYQTADKEQITEYRVATAPFGYVQGSINTVEEKRPVLCVFVDREHEQLKAALINCAAYVKREFAGVWVAHFSKGRMSHGELVARKIFGFQRSPALGVLCGGEPVMVCADVESIVGSLNAELAGAVERSKLARSFRQAPRRDAAAEAEEWQREIAALVLQYDLVIIEPEGVLKKPCNLTVKTEVQNQVDRDASANSRIKDSFYDDIVPFLRSLLLKGASLNPEAPRVAFCTLLGQRAADPHETKNPAEQKLRDCLDKVKTRLAAELGAHFDPDAIFTFRCTTAHLDDHEKKSPGRPEMLLKQAEPPSEKKDRVILHIIAENNEQFPAAAIAERVRQDRSALLTAEWSELWADDRAEMLATALALAKTKNALFIGPGDEEWAAAAKKAKVDFLSVNHLTRPSPPAGQCIRKHTDDAPSNTGPRAANFG